MSAVAMATRELFRPETPVRLRLWTALVICVALALLAASGLLLSQVREQVRVIGGEAAPQAATAADLYFALSDLDAQVARMVLVGDAAELSGSQLDALGTYQQRSRQIDEDLQRSLTTVTGQADRAIVLELMHELAVYRRWVWQTLTAQSQAPPQPPGRLPPDALGYYTQATNVLHLRLLPAAERLRDAGESRLDRAYAAKGTTEAWAVGSVLVLGGGLLVLLVALQVWLARRFRRWLNPALALATVLVLGLTAGVCLVVVAQGQRLSAARNDHLTPYLALSQARALSYDAAADTSRYLLSGNLALYQQDFAGKSARLTAVAGDLDDGGQVLDRWLGYQRDHQRVVALAGSGRTRAAVDVVTGIRRGDAAFDFSYFDAAVGAAATARKAGFDTALRDGERLLTGWPLIPFPVLAAVVLLVLLGVRARLAEYR
ncbi:hypothetical protein [Actinoplanes auranticolor]|uniref:hypothetical protein n=1 Tax=Actinoplanes auranticolor TaxID=47988 RepID=UPI001FE8AEE4|nr:hypothetical protein [Actinoplanes auranticolor]